MLNKEKNVQPTSESGNDAKPIVSGSLPISEDDIRTAADEWVFETNGMNWSNNDNTAGDNFGSFIAGAKWVLQQLGGNDR